MGKGISNRLSEATRVVVNRTDRGRVQVDFFDDKPVRFAAAAAWVLTLVTTTALLDKYKKTGSSTHNPVVYLQHSFVEPRRDLEYLTRLSENILN